MYIYIYIHMYFRAVSHGPWWCPPAQAWRRPSARPSATWGSGAWCSSNDSTDHNSTATNNTNNDNNHTTTTTTNTNDNNCTTTNNDDNTHPSSFIVLRHVGVEHDVQYDKYTMLCSILYYNMILILYHAIGTLTLLLIMNSPSARGSGAWCTSRACWCRARPAARVSDNKHTTLLIIR